MVGRENLHRFSAAGEHGAGFDDRLVVVDGKVGLVADFFEKFDVAADFIYFVLVVCENVGDGVVVKEFYDCRNILACCSERSICIFIDEVYIWRTPDIHGNCQGWLNGPDP